MNTTLAKSLGWEKEQDDLDLNLEELLKEAARVIVPIGPIATFAARSPWAGMEDQTFQQVARKLKDSCEINIFPDDGIFKNAFKRGEIQEQFLETEMQTWLNTQQLELPREIAEKYCRAALLGEESFPQNFRSSDIKGLAKKIGHLKLKMNAGTAIRTYSSFLKSVKGELAAQALNRHLIKWCKLYLDESQAGWEMPNREEGFYQAWRKLVQYDPALDRKIRKEFINLPENAEHALLEVLAALEIPSSEAQAYLEAHLLALPGWAGMILWRSQQSEKEASLLTDYLAIRLTLEYTLVKPFLPIAKKETKNQTDIEKLLEDWARYGGMNIPDWLELPLKQQNARLSFARSFDETIRNQIWLVAWEKTYEYQLMKTIGPKQQPTSENTKPAVAQFAFCIDVRSEPFRRKLERFGDFETYGTAGFFGLPIETKALGEEQGHPSLPVMFKPKYIIRETSRHADLSEYQQRKSAVDSLHSTFKGLKQNLLSSMLLPEISGPWLSLQTILRSFTPRIAGKALGRVKNFWMKKPPTNLSLHHEHNTDERLPFGFTKEEKVQYVLQALKTMSLTDHFSPLVVISGHGSHSTNNPYASALDCGACGGASSAFNARVLAELCNLEEVRAALAAEGIIIPEQTVFAAAEHVTSQDELRWIYVPKLSEAAQVAFNQINHVLPKISKESANERIKELPLLRRNNINSKEEAQRLAEDWSEVRPEWGLARNAAFIIGSRHLTEKSNLEGRVFLQNYNWRKDKNGVLLSNIINGPATVAQWINLQYYASTVAPHYYGSGNKATQTVTAGLGVMQGNASDLLTGLPWQSVMESDESAYHAPIRLLVVIQAPKEYVKRLLEHTPAFQQKLKNGWIRLASIGPDGHWESWS